MASTLIGKQAVVIGAGMAGLTAAGALADHFEQVVVLERDILPSEATYRAGTPSRISRRWEPYRSGSVLRFAWSARAMIPSRNAISAGSVTPCHGQQSSALCDGGWKAARTPRCASAVGS